MEEFTQAFNEGYAAGANGDVNALTAIIGLLIIVAIVRGGINTFRRNWILALLMLIFLSPIWAIWAFVEIFLPAPKPKVHYIEVTNRNA